MYAALAGMQQPLGRSPTWAQCVRRALPSWLLVALLVVLLPVLEFDDGRRMYITDSMLEAIKFPFQPSTVPSWSVPLYSSIVPSTVIAAHGVAARAPAAATHGGVLGSLTSLLISADVTNFFKLQVGVHRCPCAPCMLFVQGCTCFCCSSMHVVGSVCAIALALLRLGSYSGRFDMRAAQDSARTWCLHGGFVQLLRAARTNKTARSHLQQ